MLEKFLLMAATILFVFAAFYTPSPPRVNLVALGLACAALAVVLRLFGVG